MWRKLIFLGLIFAAGKFNGSIPLRMPTNEEVSQWEETILKDGKKYAIDNFDWGHGIMVYCLGAWGLLYRNASAIHDWIEASDSKDAKDCDTAFTILIVAFAPLTLPFVAIAARATKSVTA